MGPATTEMQRKSKSPCRIPRQTSRNYQRSDSESSEIMALTNNNNNRVKTWPPKTSRTTPSSKDKRKIVREESIPRPRTATLERPRVLDTSYMTKLDMSLTRKALIGITNLCKVSGSKRNNKVPLRVAARVLSVGRLRPNEADESWEDESTSEVVERPSRMRKSPKNQLNTKKNNSVNKSEVKTPRENNRKCVTSPCKRGHNVGSSPRTIPEPCRSCGRADLPERLHSHPSRQERPTVPSVTLTRPVKSSVQRPVPIRFRSSEKNKLKVQNLKNSREQKKVSQDQKNKISAVSPKPAERVSPRPSKNGSPRPNGSPKPSNSPKTPKNSNPSKSPMETSPRSKSTSPRSFVVVGEKSETKPVSPKGPRLLVCYLCGREFGTASLPLHEPRCLEKWERLNSRLPPALQRSPPEKPNHPLSVDEWNEFAWRATQAQLVPCDGCGRTFLPDRLPIHRRSCKTVASSPAGNTTPSANLQVDAVRTVAVKTPPTFVCYICGRNFGSRSLAIHEPQCLRRWHSENESRPLDQRSDEPQRETSLQQQKETPSSSPSRPSPPPLALVTCHICGRNFGTLSLPIHQPQCLRKWRHENDKLPQEKRRPEPRRPDVKYTEDGTLDHEATFHAIWESHLEQLVPCKACGRTFFPDRLEVHSRSCRDSNTTRK